MTNEKFLKLFAKENDVKIPHYYQFWNCYELLTSQPKWNSNNTKNLRDVQTKDKGKKKHQRSSALVREAHHVEKENVVDVLS